MNQDLHDGQNHMGKMRRERVQRFSILGILLILGCFFLVTGCGNGGKSDRLIIGPTPETSAKIWTLSAGQVQNAIYNATNTPWVAAETYVTKNFNQADAHVLCGWTESAPSVSTRPKTAILPAVSLPLRFSWKDKNGSNWLTPVKNQGAYGTSVAFAACAAFEGLINISQNAPSANTDVSEWYLWYKGTSGKNPNPGGWGIIQASEYLKNYGTVQEGYAVYSTLPTFSEPANTVTRLKISSWQTVEGADAMKQALLNGPLVGGLSVYTDFFYYKSGIYRQVTGNLEGNHAVLLVGYDDENKYWICKNSWSEDWGESGYCKIMYENLKSVAYAYTYYSAGIPTASTTNGVPATPVIVNPAFDQTGVDLNPTIWATSFSDTNSGDHHSQTDWEIYTASTTNPLSRVWYRLLETASKTLILVDANNGTFENALTGKTALASSTMYWVRVRYYDSQNTPSEWSALSRFTTQSASKVSPNQPTLTTPLNNDANIPVNPTLSATPFADNNQGDVHASTDWEVFNSSSLASATRVWFKLGEATYKTSITVDSVFGTFENALAGQNRLAYSNQYWAHARYYDQTGLSSRWSDAVLFTTASTSSDAPRKPLIASPSLDQLNIWVYPTFVGSTFSDPNTGDTHIKSQWEVYDSSTIATGTRVWNQLNDVSSKTSIILGANTGTFENALASSSRLSYLTRYYVRVRYFDNTGLGSDWSEMISFTTMDIPNSIPSTPSITSPAYNSTGITVSPTLISSSFSDANASDTHLQTDWEIYSTGSVPGTRVWYRANETLYKTSITVDPFKGTFENGLTGQLANATNYWIRVRYYDNRGGVSNWSAMSKFTTQ